MKPQDNDVETEIKEDATQPESGKGEEPSLPGGADIQAIADTLTDSMPEVQEHAIAQEAQQQAEEKAQWSDLRDRDGNPFDPAVHKTNKDGEPTLSPKGLLIKKPGRKPGQSTTKPVGSVVGGHGKPADPTIAAAAEKEGKARLAGAGMANMFIATSVMVMGEEWAPKQGEVKIGDTIVPVDEKAQLEQVFGDWCVATDQGDLPPGLALAAGLLIYSAPRFNQPQTKARTQGWWQSVKKWIANRKLKRHGLKAEKLEAK